MRVGRSGEGQAGSQDSCPSVCLSVPPPTGHSVPVTLT